MNRCRHNPNKKLLNGAWAAWVVAALIASTGGHAYASDDSAQSSPRGVAAAEVGYGSLGDDGFLNVRLKLGYSFSLPQLACDEEDAQDCQTDLQLAAQAPLRLRIVDAGTPDDTLLRRADWDEPSDYLRLVRRLQYGGATEPLHVKIGELGPVSLGHGSIVNDYYNVITVDHYQMGVAGELSTVYGGAELLLDNVISPSIVGGRAFVRPWAFVDRDSLLSRVSIGASAVTDVDAPTRLAAEADQPDSVVDRTFHPIVTDEQTTALVGVDVEVSVVESRRFGLVPYVDLNSHSTLGSGLHAGAFATVQPMASLEFISQLEYRRLGTNYLPNYVGPMYEVDRFQFSGWGQQLPAPKVRVAASLNTQPAHGLYAALTGRTSELFSATVAYSDHQGPANRTLRLQASSRPIDAMQVGIFYYNQNFEGLTQAFDLDGALAVGEARVALYGPLFAMGSYGRMWRIRDDGTYRSVDDWNCGVGVAMGF